MPLDLRGKGSRHNQRHMTATQSTPRTFTRDHCAKDSFFLTFLHLPRSVCVCRSYLQCPTEARARASSGTLAACDRNHGKSPAQALTDGIERWNISGRIKNFSIPTRFSSVTLWGGQKRLGLESDAASLSLCTAAGVQTG